MKCQTNQFNCPVEATLSLIGGKYKPLILWHLIDHPLHYMELQRLIPNATPKMLSQQLHDLENNGMIHREVIPEKPPKTVYSLTSFGQSIVPIIVSLSISQIRFAILSKKSKSWETTKKAFSKEDRYSASHAT